MRKAENYSKGFTKNQTSIAGTRGDSRVASSCGGDSNYYKRDI